MVQFVLPSLSLASAVAGQLRANGQNCSYLPGLVECNMIVFLGLLPDRFVEELPVLPIVARRVAERNRALLPRVQTLPLGEDNPATWRLARGCDYQATRKALRELGIKPPIPRRGRPEEPPPGRLRWPVERALSWLKQFRRLRVRWDCLAGIHEAFLALACWLIAWRRLRRRVGRTGFVRRLVVESPAISHLFPGPCRRRPPLCDSPRLRPTSSGLPTRPAFPFPSDSSRNPDRSTHGRPGQAQVQRRPD